MSLLILAFAVALAFANGANDNGKGVASLVAYGETTPRTALVWAAVTTLLGSALSAFWGAGLLAAFRAQFVGGGETLPPAFYAAVLAGGTIGILFATRTGLPVSTTHAITGGLVGAGVLAVGAGRIAWPELVERFALPLALGPLVSVALVYVAARPLRALARRSAERCACVVTVPATAVASGGGLAAVAQPALAVGEVAECAARGPLAIVRGQDLLRGVHWLSSGLVGFARGWNDTPKIAALALVALPGADGSRLAFVLVAVAMAAGGLVAARRVLETLAHRITALPLGESVAASGTASLLVSLASFRGLPLSTTHVTTGAIVGAGLARDPRGVRWGMVRDIALAWLVTLPAAGLLAFAAFVVLR